MFLGVMILKMPGLGSGMMLSLKVLAFSLIMKLEYIIIIITVTVASLRA
jgi:hypothetical protein